ncbi:MAG: flippase-like domain-containing protein [Candidatus Cloacimonetes bacterium]|nr:flippase-like domain-containing protein [Candidatus Cloacimonadota bacterium]
MANGDSSYRLKLNPGFFIRVTISILLIVLISLRIDWQEVWANLMELKAIAIVFVILFSYFQIVLNVLIQKSIFSIFNFKVALADAFKHNLISSMFLLFIPGFFAPDFYLTYYYGKSFRKYSRVISGLLFNRLAGFTIFLLCALAALLVLQKDVTAKLNDFRIDISPGKTLIIILAFSILAALIIFFRGKISNLLRRLKTDYQAIKKDFHNNRFRVLLSFVLKVFWYFCAVAARVVLAKLLGVEVATLQLTAVILFINLLVALPISISGIGVRETGYIGFLTLFGIDKNLALTLAFLDFAIIIVAAVSGGFLFLLSQAEYKSSGERSKNHE